MGIRNQFGAEIRNWDWACGLGLDMEIGDYDWGFGIGIEEWDTRLGIGDWILGLEIRIG